METKEREKMVRFTCPKNHVWYDPMPTEDAPAMAKLFGTCPACPKLLHPVQGTAKEA